MKDVFPIYNSYALTCNLYLKYIGNKHRKFTSSHDLLSSSRILPSIRDFNQIKGKFRQEVTVVRASCDECGVNGDESHKLDFGKTEKLVRMGCVTVEKFRKRWNIEDGCFSYDPVSLRV